MWGLDKDWREFIEDSIPLGEETLDNAFNQALKYEAKLQRKPNMTGAAMLDHMHLQQCRGEPGSSGSQSENEAVSDEDAFKAITESVTRALVDGLKKYHFKPKRSSDKR